MHWERCANKFIRDTELLTGENSKTITKVQHLKRSTEKGGNNGKIVW